MVIASRVHSGSRPAFLLALLTVPLVGCGAGGDTGDSGTDTDPGGGGGRTVGASYAPDWASAAPARLLVFDRDPGKSDTENGTDLANAMRALEPGDRLEIGTGTFSIPFRFDISLHGTADQPIRIAAKSGATPVITRPDASQNVLNVGGQGGASYLSFEGLEVTGGSDGFRIYDCSEVRIDDCHVHHLGGVAIVANTHDTDHLWLTRNEIHDTGGHGEGFYLGGNHASAVMRNSVIALNWVHDTGGSQGDGIEVKQGSHGNLIAYNLVHDTNYPCIIAYGTGGHARNVIEGNICLRSRDNAMQVQGEAIVRNNLIVDGRAAGFASRDHQGQVRNLTVVHNTIITSSRGAYLSNWSGREGMVFANNVVYSSTGDAIRFAGSDGAVCSGNVVLGNVSGIDGGWVEGNGLEDFAGLAWDGSTTDARPMLELIHHGADPLWAEPLDLDGRARTRAPAAAGCLD